MIHESTLPDIVEQGGGRGEYLENGFLSETRFLGVGVCQTKK
ncbi:hypothetical protein VL20_4831 [Microcystis panniformis FACHB-1757]|uniref:Uncharacterized protein n=1 Tax=Microcystis panniformis FACHB-1757 TaxID=1638788 RepID=A0A0K1S6W6_9CHRO|nr:hypothetical protein VL20_4831 [Microcystis panniformis FACHB-1757]